MIKKSCQFYFTEMRSYCPKLTRIENLTQGLIARRCPEDMFLVREVEGKGRGVFLKAPILPKDSFVLEYEGDVISAAEADIREQFYSSNGEGCFIMYFTFKVRMFVIPMLLCNASLLSMCLNSNFLATCYIMVNYYTHSCVKFFIPLLV